MRVDVVTTTEDGSVQNQRLKRGDEQRGGRYMALNAIATSDAAKSLVKALTARVETVTPAGNRNKLESAVAAILADLLASSRLDAEQWSYRSTGSGDFTGLPIGYRPFKAAREGFQRLGWVDYKPGVYKRWGGEASRCRANAILLGLVKEAGITPEAWDEHFTERPRPKVISKPIILRAEKRLRFGELQGRKMPVPWTHPKVIKAKEQMDRINRYFASVPIGGASHHGFKRMFGAGTDPEYNWDMGGRAYSLGGGYQSMKSHLRAGITIRNEATIELDIKASHLTIIDAAFGTDRKGIDPYQVEGIPRSVVKSWVTMCLGYGKFHTRWSNEARLRFAEENNGLNLEAEYPLASVREKLKVHLPEIGFALERGIGWARLQYIESCAIIDAVEELALIHDVPALPVHDSLIVPASKEAIAREVLGRTFEHHVGVRPTLEVKG